MKKRLCLSFFLLLILYASVYGFFALADEYEVALPEFDVTLNGIAVETADHNRQVYPFIVLEDVTYFPLTYSNLQLLGFNSEWTAENGLVISKRDITETGKYRSGQFPNTQMEESTERHENRLCFERSKGIINIDGKIITEEMLGYPILEFSDVTYLPLTYSLASDILGAFEYTFTAEGGLSVSCESKFIAHIYYIDHAYHDRVVTKSREEFWYYGSELKIRVNCGTQRLLGASSQNMTAFFPDGTSKRFGEKNDCFGYSDAPEDEKRWVGGDKLDYSDGWIYTTYGSYWGGVSPVYCKINAETGEIIILDEK